MNKLQIEYIPISEIVEYQNNPKKHPKEQIEKIKSSLKENGFVNPILLNKDNVIIAGHGRKQASEELGYKEVPVIWLEHLSEAQQKAFRIADNKLTESEWDNELLNIEFEGLEELEFDTDLTGFDNKEISQIYDQFNESKEDNFDTEKAIKEPKYKVKRGDIYELDSGKGIKHRIMCGDSTKKEDVDKLMNGQKADMVFTDPPYNVGYKGSKDKEREMFENEKMSHKDFEEFLYKVFSNMSLTIKESAPVFSCCATLSAREFKNAFERAGFEVTNQIIWKKDRTTYRVGGRMCYKWAYEPILFAIRENPMCYHDICTSSNVWEVEAPISFGNRKDDSGKYTDGKSSEHGTSKPLKLCKIPITNHSKSEDIVQDLFLGSGSTLIACEQTNRICYGMEIDPTYCSVVIERFEAYSGKKAEKIN